MKLAQMTTIGCEVCLRCAAAPCYRQVMVKLKRVHGHMSSVGGSFWDLGAGVGKLVIAASMMHNFEVRHITHARH